MLDLFSIIFVVLLVSLIVIVEVLIRKGKLRPRDSYTYRPALLTGLRWFLFALLFCFFVYIFTGSLEASFTLGIFLLVCIIAGCLKALHVEYRIKKRGGRRID